MGNLKFSRVPAFFLLPKDRKEDELLFINVCAIMNV